MPAKSPARDRVLKRLQGFSHLLDRALPIPGTPYRFGLDPILGLLPGGGDFIGAAFSAYIIWESARVGIPRETIGKMAFNIILEMAVGVVPVLGDLVDVAWKANVKNVELLESHLDELAVTGDGGEAELEAEAKANRGVAIAAIVAVAVVMVLAAIGTLVLVRWIWTLLSGT